MPALALAKRILAECWVAGVALPQLKGLTDDDEPPETRDLWMQWRQLRMHLEVTPLGHMGFYALSHDAPLVCNFTGHETEQGLAQLIIALKTQQAKCP